MKGSPFSTDHSAVPGVTAIPQANDTLDAGLSGEANHVLTVR